MNDRWTQHLMDKCGVAWFKFNEPSGNVLDNKGSFVGTPTNIDRLVENDEHFIHFKGTSGSRVVLKGSVTPMGKKSIYFKVRTTQTTASRIIGNSGAIASTRGIFIGTSDNGIITVIMSINKSPYNFRLNSPNSISDGQWHDILFTWDGTTNQNGAKLYIDNMLAPIAMGTALETEKESASYNITLGSPADQFTNYLFNGDLRNVQVYNYVIDPMPKFNLINIDNKYFTYKNNEFIEVEPTIEKFEANSVDLSKLTTPTNKVGLTMSEGVLIGEGREFRKLINMTEFKNKYGEIRGVSEV